MAQAPDPRLVRALDHPVRAAFLRLLTERDALGLPEALELLDGQEVALSRLAYHVRLLDRLELVEPIAGAGPAGRVPFRTTSTGEAALAALGLSSKKKDDD